MPHSIPPRLLRLLGTPGFVWIVFAVVHGALAVLNLVNFKNPYGDVLAVYPYWVDLALQGDIVGITEPWVYPLLAWVPILLASIGGSIALPGFWIVVVTGLNAIALHLLLGTKHGRTAGLLWMVLLASLGPVAIGRIDSVTAPIAIIGLLAMLRSRIGVAATLFTIAAWMKVWPGVLWLALVITRRERWTAVYAGAAVSLSVVVLAFIAGGTGNLASFAFEQGERGLQVESVAATPFVWMALFGNAVIEYSREILTYQVEAGPATSMLASVLTPVMVVGVMLVLVLGVVGERRGVNRVQLWVLMTTALVALLIVCNKVGSPQFVAWLSVCEVALVIVRPRHATRMIGMIVLIAVLTQLIYPWNYGAIVGEINVFGASLMTLRNLLEIGLCASAIASLVHVVRHPRCHQGASGPGSVAVAPAAGSQEPLARER
ncbi:hypothetical protein [Humidisolicoccus flavus]|uniref:hypothetical protein n=1 Tax=Humidisolicoccus flavus TaxID=3111414 RepID=UPI0032545666